MLRSLLLKRRIACTTVSRYHVFRVTLNSLRISEILQVSSFLWTTRFMAGNSVLFDNSLCTANYEAHKLCQSLILSLKLVLYFWQQLRQRAAFFRELIFYRVLKTACAFYWPFLNDFIKNMVVLFRGRYFWSYIFLQLRS